MSVGLPLFLAVAGVAAFGIWSTIRIKEIRKRRGVRAQGRRAENAGGSSGEEYDFGTAGDSDATPFEGEGGDFGGGGASGDWDSDGGDD